MIIYKKLEIEKLTFILIELTVVLKSLKLAIHMN